ncbi:type II toxin-antitoxin system VapB family antitoxin [Cysteiniphilum sp. QT6929]|uniref:antitoxin n=1 Tax=Cysteiniphilum sp. QT6929 TaxID=2975055 RepID=UPI0024B34889|nr:type II toxin-antitoxin system VapB family antitoxin [Cysteiniphilum sp. QT6929]WHN66613.1 type II toxin-antitoxin system VapB family antitoxin [Cysteiniphilum sp. QT6929]
MISTVFKNGNSQAIRIPKSLKLESNKVDINKIGNSLIVREIPQSWEQAFKCLDEFDHFMVEKRIDLPLQKREDMK